MSPPVIERRDITEVVTERLQVPLEPVHVEQALSPVTVPPEADRLEDEAPHRPQQQPSCRSDALLASRRQPYEHLPAVGARLAPSLDPAERLERAHHARDHGPAHAQRAPQI